VSLPSSSKNQEEREACYQHHGGRTGRHSWASAQIQENEQQNEKKDRQSHHNSRKPDPAFDIT
jgi:hypothetical protein